MTPPIIYTITTSINYTIRWTKMKKKKKMKTRMKKKKDGEIRKQKKK